MNLHITETVLRDGNQSLIATRLPLDSFREILETMDRAGYYSVECWGGATFDACLRYLDEDPWARLDALRAAMPHTKLQMLLRGQNLLGYKHYPDDVVEGFVKKSAQHGIDIIRVFDALNDLRNLRTAIRAGKEAGIHVQGALCYTTSPIHTVDSFVELARELERMGVDSVCIKDMAGLLMPQVAYDLVKAIKAAVRVPVALHTHCTAGLGQMTQLMAMMAGVDILDCAISAFSGGTAQPATEAMHFAAASMGVETGLDPEALSRINAFFKPIRKDALDRGLMNPDLLFADPEALRYQVPGGMLSNLSHQLKAQGALDRLPEVLAEVPRVREDLGYPPLVTPSSQMVGAQAAANVLLGQRYKNISKEIRAYLRGEYGRAPGAVNEELRRMALGDEEPITCRPADLLEPGLSAAAQETAGLVRTPEELLSYIAYPQLMEPILREREERERNRCSYTLERIE